MTGADPVRLATVAGWDPRGLQGGVRVLEAVAGRLPSWRFRLEAVGRALESAGAWSGPAARAAVGAVQQISAVTTAVDDACERSLGACEDLLRTADAAASLARQALSLADGADVAADPAAGTRRAVLSQEALQQADRATAAALAAGEALAVLGVVDAFVGADFPTLAGRVTSPAPVLPAAAAPPHVVAGWWAGLSAPARRQLIESEPAAIGRLDGLPAWARDRANRSLLGRSMAGAAPSGTARAVAAEIASREADGESVQLFAFDEDGERVALAVGDLDTAEAVAVLVPGIGTTPEDDLDAVTATVGRVASTVASGAPGLTVAGLAWLGYRPPRGPAILFRGAARRAGPVLDGTLDGLAASRRAVGHRASRTTLLAHSYGTVVVDEAADAPGRLAADAVVLLGSPGMDPEGAGGLEAAEVHHAASPADPVSWAGYFGQSPWGAGFGSQALPVDLDTGHSDYLDADRPTLAAVAGVLTGPPRPP